MSQQTEFPTDFDAPAAFVGALAELKHGWLRWHDTSWHNDAAPSWSLMERSGECRVTVFYHTTENPESDHAAPYVVVLRFDDEGGQCDAFMEGTPEEFLAHMRNAGTLDEVIKTIERTR